MIAQWGNTIGWALLQGMILLLLAPLIQGVIKKVKARLQGRIGPSVWQPYYDLLKYMRKEAVISEHASWLTVVTPTIAFTVILITGLCVPTFRIQTPLEWTGDIILIVYLFGIVRFFTALTALDAGSSFGGMGSNREMALSAIAEPALLLVVLSTFLFGGTSNMSNLIPSLIFHGWNWAEPSYLFAFAAMFILVIAETGRIPVDNPDTHLELTMIHEGMLLEYSGRYLGLMLWASQMKQLLILSLFVNLFFPWGMATDGEIELNILSFFLYVMKLVVLGVVLAFTETLNAKMRLFRVPKLLVSSMILSLLAILFQLIK